MKPPIFIFDSSDDVLAFASPAQAEGHVESVDVEDAEYSQAFDSEGRLLALEVEQPTGRNRFLGLEFVALTPVRVVEMEAEPGHAEDLRRALLDALTRVGHSGGLASASMGELVEEAFRIFRKR